jgi:hypothetical protein
MLISPSWCACLSDECIVALSAMIFFGLFVISNHLSSRDRKAIGLPSIAMPIIPRLMWYASIGAEVACPSANSPCSVAD